MLDMPVQAKLHGIALVPDSPDPRLNIHQQLSETTMQPEKRTLLRVRIEDGVEVRIQDREQALYFRVLR